MNRISAKKKKIANSVRFFTCRIEEYIAVVLTMSHLVFHILYAGESNIR